LTDASTGWFRGHSLQPRHPVDVPLSRSWREQRTAYTVPPICCARSPLPAKDRVARLDCAILHWREVVTCKVSERAPPRSPSPLLPKAWQTSSRETTQSTKGESTRLVDCNLRLARRASS
jgi:hypothetical protein